MPPGPTPSFREATAADLENNAFAFSDGAAFDAALANQEVTLDFAQLDASNTAAFRLQSGGLIAGGTTTLQAPLTLTLRVIEPGLPFTLNQRLRFAAKIDDNAGSLKLTNTRTKTTTISAPGTASPAPPALLRASLIGTPVLSTVTSTASGSAALVFNAAQTKIAFTLEYTGLTDVLQAHIHVGVGQDTGDIIFFLCTNQKKSPVENTPTCPEAAGAVAGALTTAQLLSPAIGSGVTVTSFADAVSALSLGVTYVDIHTEAFPDGELRGKIEQTVTQTRQVSFKTDILPIFTSIDLGGVIGCASIGCHSGGSPQAGLNLEADQAYDNLVGVPSTETPTLHRVEPGDPDNSYLFRKHTGQGIAPGTERMPLINPTFFDEHPELLELERLWIEQGAENN
jgi:CHRD domain